MNVIVFDTETTDVSKWKFCYNVGWVVYDPIADVRLVKRDFVVEQIWHNTELFATAYYATKRPIYIKAMRARQTVMDKWGYIMQTMMRDIKKYEVQCAYAYNSPFDDAVFTFNCDWFKTQNPFDNLPIYDLVGLATQFITNTEEYRAFCEEHECFTDAENYSVTAETVYKFLSNDPDFVEAHTALADAEIEAYILRAAFLKGAMIDVEYSKQMPKRKVLKPFKVMVDGVVVAQGKYVRKWSKKDDIRFVTGDA